ncbi:protein of unknown function [Shewanella benthica]|uniref:Uncharacterized protein n=1 Tax=Shewanella benthica TaxID=43661 RepID=A0A330M2Y9_9GAMM|nr:protein of unknown function [Shewanella benthica]
MPQKGITISLTMRRELKALRGSELIINLMELVFIPVTDNRCPAMVIMATHTNDTLMRR